MFSGGPLTAATIKAVFVEEIAAQRGSVPDAFEDGTRLFLRALLPQAEEVRPEDRVQSGVALRANGCEVWLHPYVFRLVCRNGAIMAQATQTHHLTDLPGRPPEEAVCALREGIRACSQPEAFTAAALQMRTAREAAVDLHLMLLPMLSRFPREAASRLFGEILQRFTSEGDNSLFGLMNAVTATARDTREPELRWDLEEFGGGMLVLRAPKLPSTDSGGLRERRGQAVLAG